MNKSSGRVRKPENRRALARGRITHGPAERAQGSGHPNKSAAAAPLFRRPDDSLLAPCSRLLADILADASAAVVFRRGLSLTTTNDERRRARALLRAWRGERA